MFETLTQAEILRRRECRGLYSQLLTLDMRCFYLERRVGNLEHRWPGSSGAEQRRNRMERMAVRTELELLKIDLASIERRSKPFLQTTTDPGA